MKQKLHADACSIDVQRYGYDSILMMFLSAAKYSLEMHRFRMLFSHRFVYRIPSHDIALIDCTCCSCSVGDVE